MFPEFGVYSSCRLWRKIISIHHNISPALYSFIRAYQTIQGTSIPTLLPFNFQVKIETSNQLSFPLISQLRRCQCPISPSGRTHHQPGAINTAPVNMTKLLLLFTHFPLLKKPSFPSSSNIFFRLSSINVLQRIPLIKADALFLPIAEYPFPLRLHSPGETTFIKTNNARSLTLFCFSSA